MAETVSHKSRVSGKATRRHAATASTNEARTRTSKGHTRISTKAQPTAQGRHSVSGAEPALAEPAIQQLARPVEALISSLDFPPNCFPTTTKMLVHGETKWIEWDFSDSDFETLEIVQITDVQWGHITCKRDRVREYRDWVLSEPNRYMVWTGDNIDSATMQSKGTTWENTGSPQQQMFEFVQEWAPARHRILGYVGGNHERRVLTTFGDLGITIAALLRIPYSRGKQLIDIKFGEHRTLGRKGLHPFRISQWHGAGGARTKGTVAQTLSRFASDGDSQLYLMGHLHQAMVIPMFKERRGERGIRSVKCIAAMGSSFLDLWGSYGEVMGFGPGDVIMPRCLLGRDGSWEVTLKSWLLPLLAAGSLLHGLLRAFC
jgi:hypothetical protein